MVVVGEVLVVVVVGEVLVVIAVVLVVLVAVVVVVVVVVGSRLACPQLPSPEETHFAPCICLSINII